MYVPGYQLSRLDPSEPSPISRYDRNQYPKVPPQPPDVPQLFFHAMTVRTRVFTHEQGCPLESEWDEDDARSWHWVVYRSADMSPLGAVRLVPPPHTHHLHDYLTVTTAVAPEILSIEEDEPFIKLGRFAVVKEARRVGLGKLLVDSLLQFASEHAIQIRSYTSSHQTPWNGLVLIHAQKNVERSYTKWGFVTDERMGEWIEDGILHVGMWTRVPVPVALHS